MPEVSQLDRRLSDSTIDSNFVQQTRGIGAVSNAKKAVANFKKRKEKKGFITEDRDVPEDFKGI